VLPVLNGYPIMNAIEVSDVGAIDVDIKLKELLKCDNINYKHDDEIIDDIKFRCLTCMSRQKFIKIQPNIDKLKH